MDFEQLAFYAAWIASGALIGFLAYLALVLLKRMFGRRLADGVIANVFRRTAPGLRFFLPLAGVAVALYSFELDNAWLGALRLTARLLLIAAGAWILIRVVDGVEDVVEAQLGLDQADNLNARRAFTQLRLLRRVLVAFIAFAAIVVMLLSFDGARQIGAGLLASAGLAGLVIGFAAQRALGNLLAGFQIAITQPIRLDDVLVVEGEWGRVEEITLTYVVIRIWDERRLILPISYFLEKPFTNWTRESSDILGTVYLYADYTVPIAALRQELDRIVEASPHWDGRFKNLVVTDSKANTVELRALVSARDGGAAWDLRCEVREGLISFLQREYPDSLPKFRAELKQSDAGS